MQMNEMNNSFPSWGSISPVMKPEQTGKTYRRAAPGGRAKELPPFICWNEVPDPLPEPPEEMIPGFLRRGHKMLLSGPSKAGKSFLLLELSIAIAEGRPWLNIPCRQGKVLYVNLEIEDASCFHRVDSIVEALGIEQKHKEDLVIWNLRGRNVTASGLVTELIRRLEGEHYDVVILDPIYKLLPGNENSAEDISRLCREFDRLCTETGCALIFSHHHSKGAQGSKRAMDRSSGSGVFARDPDAILDLIQLRPPADLRETLRDSKVTAWRIEGSLREFEDFEPINVWFEYPLHRVDESGALARGAADGSPEANLLKSSKRTSKEERKERLDNAYDNRFNGRPLRITELAEEMEVDVKTVRRYLKEFEDEYWFDNGSVFRETL